MRILGLDLGVASIGWALIEVDDKYLPVKIDGLGVRIVSLADKEGSDFSSGKGVSACAQRTIYRTARKGNDRYRMRRTTLKNFLNKLGMIDPKVNLNLLPPLDLWALRAEGAVNRKLTLNEIGRVLLHLNQKRGYRHSKNDTSEDAKNTDYVAKINERYAELRKSGMTIGQVGYQILKDSIHTSVNGKKFVTGRIKEGSDIYSASHLYPRQAHIDEFDRIMEVQSSFYPDLLTPEVITKLRHIIFFQRPLKSCKNLVSDCEFVEYFVKDTATGEIKHYRPKVAPVTSPLAQESRIWETVNNLRLENPMNKPRKGKNMNELSLWEPEINSHEWRLLQREYILTLDEKKKVVDFLRKNEKLTSTNLLKLLGLKKSDGFKPNIGAAGIKGNTTYFKLNEILQSYPEYRHLLDFNLEIEEKRVDQETGEVIPEISDRCYHQPLYELWHLLYSVSEKKDVEATLKTNFGITEQEVIDSLFALDFKTAGFSKKSAKFIRRILPYLMEGKMYSEACEAAGVRHSDYITSEENIERQLKETLSLLPKGSLRQPTVEKILNQMINVVNALIKEYGAIDEVRIELARELRQTKDQRSNTTKEISLRETDNKRIAKLIEQYGLKASRNTIQKYRMWEEAGGRCVYCGKPISITTFLAGNGAEKEHIVPRSVLFDDSFSNKTLSCTECNRTKGARTGYDFVASQGEKKLEEYLARVENMANNSNKKLRISRTKYKRLLTPGSDIPKDFLNRDLGETQYISRKAMELLREVVRNVGASTGKITDFFRHLWGYDKILHDLNLSRYESADLVIEDTFTHNGQTHTERRIKDWSKRMDHRHHAIDALTVALTRQRYVQRLNNLNAEHGNLKGDIESNGKNFKSDKSLITQWGEACPHFPVSVVKAAVDRIAVSFKPGKKVATSGKRKRKNGTEFKTFVPKGGLHLDTIYGKIKVPTAARSLKDCLKNPDMVSDREIAMKLKEVLSSCAGDISKAQKEIKKNPIKFDKENQPILYFPCYEERMTVRAGIASLSQKNASEIVDPVIRRVVEERFQECGSEKAYQQSLPERPIEHPAMPGIPVKYVKIFASVTPDTVVPVRKHGDKAIGFAKPGSNHHVAFYQQEDGNISALVTPFWVAVNRKKLGLDPIIHNPQEAWDKIIELGDKIDESLLTSMPLPNDQFMMSLQQNEMVILGLSDDQWNDAWQQKDLKTLTSHLYRVQKMSDGDYFFRLHNNTSTEFNADHRIMQTVIRCTSLKTWRSLNPHKVSLTHTGQIIPLHD